MLDARVVDQNIHAAKCCLGVAHHGLDFIGLRHVRAVVAHLCPQRFDLGHGGVHFAKAVHHDVGALGGQGLGQA